MAEKDTEPEAGPVPPGSKRSSLDDVKARVAKRLKAAARTDELVDAWGAAVTQQAIDLALTSGPLPSTLLALRADLLMHVCLQAKRLISVRETEVLLRLTPTGARSVHRQMKSTYEDLLEEYVLAWAFAGASSDKGGSYMGVVNGTRVIFESKEALDLAKRELDGLGVTTAQKRGESEYPHLLYVGAGADISRFDLPEPKAKASRRRASRKA